MHALHRKVNHQAGSLPVIHEGLLTRLRARTCKRVQLCSNGCTCCTCSPVVRSLCVRKEVDRKGPSWPKRGKVVTPKRV
eukprot:12238-Heterococcus_DN1.PRE.3